MEEKPVKPLDVRVEVWVDPDDSPEDAKDPSENKEINWGLEFVFAHDYVTKFLFDKPNAAPLELWRDLARGVPGTRIYDDLYENSGYIEIVGTNCAFHCEGAANIAVSVVVPHIRIAEPLSRALDEAVSRKLYFLLKSEPKPDKEVV